MTAPFAVGDLVIEDGWLGVVRDVLDVRESCPEIDGGWLVELDGPATLVRHGVPRIVSEIRHATAEDLAGAARLQIPYLRELYGAEVLC